MAQKALESLENREQLMNDLFEWMSAESSTVMKCFDIQDKTDNPFVRLMAEIILGSSKTHIRILNLIHECLTKKAISLTPDELEQIWDLVSGYMEAERKSVDMAEQAISRSRIFVVRHLLALMLDDESRNLQLLEQLQDFKKKMYPYL